MLPAFLLLQNNINNNTSGEKQKHTAKGKLGKLLKFSMRFTQFDFRSLLKLAHYAKKLWHTEPKSALKLVSNSPYSLSAPATLYYSLSPLHSLSLSFHLLCLVIVVLILNNTLAYRSQNKSINCMLHKTA